MISFIVGAFMAIWIIALIEAFEWTNNLTTKEILESK
jgi:hypothetical protein|tara:strand:+ start:383 stop:493 length:111 start_codon:yes stop_codon:yes gene_type:complete